MKDLLSVRVIVWREVSLFLSRTGEISRVHVFVLTAPIWRAFTHSTYQSGLLGKPLKRLCSLPDGCISFFLRAAPPCAHWIFPSASYRQELVPSERIETVAWGLPGHRWCWVSAAELDANRFEGFQRLHLPDLSQNSPSPLGPSASDQKLGPKAGSIILLGRDPWFPLMQPVVPLSWGDLSSTHNAVFRK